MREDKCECLAPEATRLNLCDGGEQQMICPMTGAYCVNAMAVLANMKRNER